MNSVENRSPTQEFYNTSKTVSFSLQTLTKTYVYRSFKCLCVHSLKRIYIDYFMVGECVKRIYIDYFMVGECVRFLFTSCEGSGKRTSERSERVSLTIIHNE